MLYLGQLAILYLTKTRKQNKWYDAHDQTTRQNKHRRIINEEQDYAKITRAHSNTHTKQTHINTETRKQQQRTERTHKHGKGKKTKTRPRNTDMQSIIMRS